MRLFSLFLSLATHASLQRITITWCYKWYDGYDFNTIFWSVTVDVSRKSSRACLLQKCSLDAALKARPFTAKGFRIRARFSHVYNYTRSICQVYVRSVSRCACRVCFHTFIIIIIKTNTKDYIKINWWKISC